MAITKTQAVQGLAALMFGQAVGTTSAANFREILANDPSIYNLANNLAQTDTFNNQFRSDDRQDKIDLILGRLGLQEGSDSYDIANEFVTTRLDDGIPAGQVIAEIGEKLLGDSIPRGFAEASEVLRDAIERSNAHLEAGNEGNVSLQLGDGVTTALLAQAIEEYRTAFEARNDFLEDAAEVEGVAALLADEDGVAPAFSAEDTATAVEDYYEATASTLGDLLNVGDLEDRGVSTQDILISDAQTSANAQVTTAGNALGTSGVRLLNTAQNRLDALNTANDAAVTAQTNFVGEVARFNSVNGLTVDEDGSGGVSITEEDGVTVLQIDGDTVATRGTNGTFRADSGFNASDFEGFSALLAAATTQGRAAVAAETAQGRADVAIQNLAEAQGFTFTTDGTDDFNFDDFTDTDDGDFVLDGSGFDIADEDNLVSAYINAIEARNTLNEAVTEFQEARTLAVQLDELDTALETATTTILEDYDFVIRGFDEDAGNGNDLYIFADNVGNSDDNDIDNFGDEGTDYIFFGEGYTAVALTEGQTINSRVGDANTLEIFWRQDGDDLVLYVEADATAGNSTSNADITEITLTGVNVQDVDFSNGFLSVNNAA
ncbi:hypothetical protein [Vreelandella sp. EE22]